MQLSSSKSCSKTPSQCLTCTLRHPPAQTKDHDDASRTRQPERLREALPALARMLDERVALRAHAQLRTRLRDDFGDVAVDAELELDLVDHLDQRRQLIGRASRGRRLVDGLAHDHRPM